MPGDSVPLEFSPDSSFHPAGKEFTSNPIDVSEFTRATVVCWGGIPEASAGGRVVLTLQESTDRVTWMAPGGPGFRRSSEGEFEEESLLRLNRPWLRAKVAITRPLPVPGSGRPPFVAEIRLEKRRP